MFNNLPRVSLAHLPTPLEAMPRLTEALGGARLFIKRDDQTGLATGGNKTRKLEFLLADALAQEADTVITSGAVQSNHCRQTAAAAARHGLGCVLILRGDEPERVTGNLLLDRLLGARTVFYGGGRVRDDVLAEVVESERAASRTPYTIPGGGSAPLGAAAYALAMTELKTQMEAAGIERFDRIVFASSSGGTQAGMLAGAVLTRFHGQVLGISISDEAAWMKDNIARLATGTMQLLGQPHTFAPDEVEVNADYLGKGYATVGHAEREAIKLFAQNEGVLLDPVYSGRAAAGLIDLMRRQVIRPEEQVLFWHTGGTPALFAYAGELTG